MQSLSLPEPLSLARAERVGVFAVMGLGATMLFSIAAAQILLGLAVLCWLGLHLGRHTTVEAPSFFWPLVAYAAATLVAAGFSLNPAISLADSKQLFLFLLVPLVYDFARGARADTLLTIIISVGAASAFVYRHGEAFYNFQGLRAYKEKFDPEWEPRYLAYPGGLRLPRILADVAALVAGGYRRILAR